MNMTAQDLDMMLKSDNVYFELDTAMTNGLFSTVPELEIQLEYEQDTPFHDFTLWEHTKRVVSNIPNTMVADTMLDLRWAGLFHDIAKPYTRTVDQNGIAHYRGHNLVGAKLFMKIAERLNLEQSRAEYVYSQIYLHLTPKSDLFIYDNMSKKLTY
jgi:tRNA nucleotidyltransferase (CCA-adding enzyme)